MSKGSDTLKLAGERGFIPMSLNLNPAYVGSHWESVEAGAAKTGRKPNRADWRLVREVFVADTDEEAWKLSAGDMMGRMMGEYFLPLLGHFGFKDYLKHAPDVPDSDVTVDYCARRNWIVGSPATVAEKIETIYREVGGFGVLLVFGFDYKHKPEAWKHSLSLLKNEVLPRLKHLDAELGKAGLNRPFVHCRHCEEPTGPAFGATRWPAMTVWHRLSPQTPHSARNRRCGCGRSARCWRQSCRRDSPWRRRS